MIWNKIIDKMQASKNILLNQRALFQALDSFLRRPAIVTKNAPHIRDATDLKRIMSIVVFSLLPCTFFGIWNVGRNTYASIGIFDCSFTQAFLEGAVYVLPLILISYTVGGICEVIFAQVRNHEVAEGFLVTGLLYPLVVPPSIPWWMFSIGIIFGVVIGKELFGGTGMNIMNPAMLSRAFLFFSYPANMSGDEVWIQKPFFQNIDGKYIASNWTTISSEKINFFIENSNVDAISGQTPLALATYLSNINATGNINNNINDIYTKFDLFFGRIPGSIGETSTMMCLVGASILITTNVASWRVILGVFTGAIFSVNIFHIASSASVVSLFDISVINHICMGGFTFGAIFMATDPVSSPLHNQSRMIYGFLIGWLCVLIRVINPTYPEGMMMAVLLMNIFAPLIDHYVLKLNIRGRNNA